MNRKLSIALLFIGLLLASSSCADASYSFVGSRNSDVYHYYYCYYVDNINYENMVYFSTTYSADHAGYRPCKVCNPPLPSYSLDTDRDGLTDYQEIIYYDTDPSAKDTDWDGLNDYEEVMEYGTDPLAEDTEWDGLADYEEIMEYGTDPLKKDTDRDELTDYEEVVDYGTDPLEEDTDGDGLTDYEEIMEYGTDPLDGDTVITGSIYVSSSPTGSNIYLDGSYEGTTPLTVSSVSTGYHTIKLTESGYDDVSSSVYVSMGQMEYVYETLTETVTTGSIYVYSSPSEVSVYLDGSYKGKTPLTVSSVSTGYHTIKLTKSGYDDVSSSAYVSAGQTEYISKTLNEIVTTGSIYVYSNPSGASIYLDGSYEGVTPDIISDVSVGSHTIELTKSGYDDVSTKVTVNVGQMESVSKKLTETEKTGSIDVYSSPSGTSIYLDGSYKGKTPLTVSSVSTGYHTIKLTKSGYDDVSSSAYVSAGQTEYIYETLTETVTTGSIDVYSSPSGASFYLDSLYKGTAPMTLSGVSTGYHTVKLTKSGYDDVYSTVDVSSGQTAFVSEILPPLVKNIPEEDVSVENIPVEDVSMENIPEEDVSLYDIPEEDVSTENGFRTMPIQLFNKIKNLFIVFFS